MFRFCETHLRQFRDERGCEVCLDEMHQQERLALRLAKAKVTVPIAQVSKKKARAVYTVSKLKALRMVSVKCCETCGYVYKGKSDIEYSHILPQSGYPEYADHPLNGLLECRDCHNVWTFGTAEQRRAQPSFHKKLTMARQILPEFAEKMTKDEFFEQHQLAS